jgi:hypothetical protein
MQAATDPRETRNFRWFNTGLSNAPQTEGEYPDPLSLLAPISSPTVSCDPAEQRAIASALGALNDKIEVNLRMNATLK